MREILFRGKRKDNGEWVEGYLYITHNGEYEIGYYNAESNIERMTYIVIPETVGECTNVPDKNGKKIFEGDILQSSYYSTKLIVAFKDGIFHLIGTPAALKYANQLEVIGNIHDNPELLKGAD